MRASRAVSFVLSSVTLQTCFVAQAQTLAWAKQFDQNEGGKVYSVAADSHGTVVIAGQTFGNLQGTHAGNGDAFIIKYHEDGDLLWRRQLGTPDTDVASALAIDENGDIFVSGYTFGDLFDESRGDYDAFVVKYAADGTPIWATQFGDSQRDFVDAIALDRLGRVYAAGRIEGISGSNVAASVHGLSSNGDLTWTATAATPVEAIAFGVATGEDGVFITGRTRGDLGGVNAGSSDIFLQKYSFAGKLQWSHLLGTPGNDEARSIATDGRGNAYVAGYSSGQLGGGNAGGSDAFLAKFSADGDLVWTSTWGTPSPDFAYSVSADQYGNLYVAGFTHGDIEASNAGFADVFVAKYSTDGDVVWRRQFGSAQWEEGLTVSGDGKGSVYVAGWTGGELFAPNSRRMLHGFLLKLTDHAFVPEPASLGTAAVTLLSGVFCLYFRDAKRCQEPFR
ncbi:Beta-propeller repeat protein [Pirellulimonas nuda]|uniref:Beta-propeller repeat protein n=1 Tax=Pirellulimonas nuda TaxID=2528009 RepID=A0A518DIL0_9BACT|nr:SBBP repeat-containing protein [Pirellulimonas nuda]QDU91319.1 Beta-propeller repeat protein [Pirellulimonas nuda]